MTPSDTDSTTYDRALDVAMASPPRKQRRLRAHAGQLLELTRAVADPLGRHAQPIQQRELQVCQRCVFWIDEMATAFESAASAADHECWQWTVCMTVAVADARSIQNDHVVEQRAIAVGSVAQLLQIIREEFQMVLLNLGALLHLDRIVLMMRQRMMRLRNADLWVRPRALLAPVHECDDAGDVRLIREKLQVVEKTGVLVETLRNARGPRDVGNFLRALLLGLLTVS